jgi:hypothetical protein
MALVCFNLNKEYLSKPKFSSKNSFIFSNKGNCSIEAEIENPGSRSVLEIKKDPSPSIYPSNQLLVTIIL